MTLIDTLATAHATYLYWLARLHQWAETDARTEDAKPKQPGYWQPLRIEAAALDWAVAMADHFN